MLNRREQVAVVVLIGVLALGSAIAIVDYWRSDALGDLRVLPAAVAYPSAAGAAAADEAPDRPPAPAAAPARAVAPTLAVADTGASPRPAPSPRVALNTASAAQLEALPGIGATLASRIVAHREQHGPFASVADLELVRGIGPRTLARLTPLLEVGPQLAAAVADSVVPRAAR